MIGVPETLAPIVLAAFWLIPVAAGIWALITLNRIRHGQDSVRERLEAIEQLLRRG